MEPLDVSNSSLDLSDFTRTNISLDTLQLKYAKIYAANSKIPIKNRQVSAPIHPLDEKSLGSKTKRSYIPRIASSPTFFVELSNPSSSKEVNLPLNKLSAYNSSVASKSPYSTPKNNKVNNTSTPPSTMTRLSNKMSGLSLYSPNISSASSIRKVSTPKKTPLKTNMSRNISDNRSSHSRTIEQRVVFSRSISSSTLNSKITDPYKPELASFDENAKPSTKPRTYRKPTHSIPKGSPSKRSISNSNQKKDTLISNEDSPLITRLTRSTTASNLKSNVKPLPHSGPAQSIPSSDSIKREPQSSSIPKPIPSRRIISDFSRPTRSSQLKCESSVTNLQTSLNERNALKETNFKLNVPKKRTITKSYTITTGIKDIITPIATSSPRESQRRSTTLNRTPSITYTKRPLSTNIPSKQEQETLKKISSAKELLKRLIKSSKTKGLVSEWNLMPAIAPTRERSPEEVIDSEPLNAYERAEILKNDKIYYLGKTSSTPRVDERNSNFGFDDKDNNLIINPKDHIKYRYEVLQRLGKGMFGDVLKCYDHKTGSVTGVKIMKNDINWSLQSMNEIKILKKLHHENVLRYIEHFNFRSHICVTTELLAVNLLEALEASNYHGFHIDVIKKWSIQLLSALNYIHSKNIIHADLKPENVMLKSPHSLDLKIIDFGSSCLQNECMYPYIQSRFYRAPEVLLGCRYDSKIDIWSFIALIYELYKGDPLFPAKDESRLFRSIVKLIGIPTSGSIISLRNDIFEKGSINKNNDKAYIDKRTMIFTHFDRLGSYKDSLSKPLELPNRSQLFHKRLDIENVEFADFIKSALIWNYKDRPEAKILLRHPFLK